MTETHDERCADDVMKKKKIYIYCTIEDKRYFTLLKFEK